MICRPCSAASDLGQAARAGYADKTKRGHLDPFERISDTVGRPTVGTVVRKAMERLHTGCPGRRSCDCPHLQAR